MRSITLLAPLGLMLALAWTSARADWTANGTPIAATDTTEDHPLVLSDGTGGAYVAWLTYSGGYPSYRLVRLDVFGGLRPGWSADGLPISGRAIDARITSDDAGGVYACWTDAAVRSVIIVNRIAPDGTSPPGWPSHGRLVGGLPVDALAGNGTESCGACGGRQPVIVSDGNEGALVAWTYITRTYDYVYPQHFLSDGTVPWDWAQTALLPYHFGSSPKICSDGSSGAFVGLWGLGLQHLLAVGQVDPIWPAGGVWLPDSLGHHDDNQGICSDGAGGLYVAWSEWRTKPWSQCFVQHITSAGAIATGWPAGGVMLRETPCVAGGMRFDGVIGYSSMSIVPDGFGGALVAWQGDTDANIFVQRLLPDGHFAPGWPSDGRVVSIALGVQELPVVVGDGDGGAIVAWQDRRNGIDHDIYAQHVMGSGALAPGTKPNGRPVCIAPGEQYQPQIASDGAGGAFITWVDYRRGSADVYAWHMTSNQTVGVEIPGPRELSVMGLAPNPVRHDLTVHYALPNSSRAELQVFDVAGRIRLWRDVTNSPGEHETRMSMDHVAGAGVYFVRLTQGGLVRTTRFCMAP